MTPAACVVCGGDRLLTLASHVGERAYCTACFHGWRVDQPTFAYSNTAMCSLGTSRARLETQIRFFGRFAPDSASILEIGCATGELAAAVRESLRPAHYDAIELSPAAEQARRHVDNLFTSPLRSLLQEGRIARRYDLILMSHVLEHLTDPAAEVEAMTKVLASGGHLFLEVPNLSGNRRLPIDDNRAHLHFFSPVSLGWMLARQGLETIATATDVRLDDRYADSLQIMARPFILPAWSGPFLSDHPALAGQDAMVVWGAGSLAEEILANFFDPARIDFFIDANPAKQGGLCLGRPVRGPDALGAAPRTILVNSIDFADAIVADIVRRSGGVTHTLVRIGALLSTASPG